MQPGVRRAGTGRRCRGATGVGPAACRQGGERGAEEGRHAARRLLHRGRHHGPASVGQQDRPPDLPQYLRAPGRAGRRARHQARPGRVLAAAGSEDPHPEAAPRREVPRRHGLQCRGGEVQLQPHEDRAQVGAQGRGGEHRHGGPGRCVHRQAQPEAPRRGAPRHAHRPRGHDGLAQDRPGARARARAQCQGRGDRPLPVRGVGEGRPPPDPAQRQLLEQAGRALSRADPLPPDSRRHGEAPEPAGGRDPRDGLCPAARRRRGQGGQERGRARRAVAGVVRLPAQSHQAAVRQQGAAPRRRLTRSTSDRSSRACG